MSNKRKHTEIEKDDDNTEEMVKFLREREINLNTIRWRLYEEMESIKKEINKVSDLLYKICDHDWEIDTSRFEPCGPTPKICHKCGSEI